MFCDVAMSGEEEDGDDTDECINEVELFQTNVNYDDNDDYACFTEILNVHMNEPN